MPVSLGAKPDHGFDQPLGLLSDCHRRIENFLGVMIRVVEHAQGGGTLAAPARDALESALRYFDIAGPRHTQDEEQSLFPRLREDTDPVVHAALDQIESLEADHRQTESLHEEAKQLCRRWLDAGPLPAADQQRLRDALRELRNIYTRHISIEDSKLFPLAARCLNREQLTEIGKEMAGRRGLAGGH